MQRISRRKALLCSSGCALAAGCLPRFSEAYGEPINIGDPIQFEVDSISEKYIRHNFFVVRRKDRLYVITASCPHEENYLFRDTGNPKQISCAGHEAYFDLEGSPLKGPVRKGLPRFEVTLDEKGHVLVDPFKEFPESAWEKPGSFVELK